MKIECPNCGKIQNIPDIYVNRKTVKCVKCKAEIPVTLSKSSFPKKTVLTGFAVFFGLLVLIIIFTVAILKKSANVKLQTIIKDHQANIAQFEEFTQVEDEYVTDIIPERQRKVTTRVYGGYKKKPKAKPKQRIYLMDEVFVVGYMAYSVWSAEWNDRLADGFGGYDYPDAAFLLVKIFVLNQDKKARMIPPFHLLDETGAEYNTSSKGPIDTLDFLVSLNPGVSKVGLIIFDAPIDHNYLLKLSGGYWSLEDAFVKIPRK